MVLKAFPRVALVSTTLPYGYPFHSYAAGLRSRIVALDLCMVCSGSSCAAVAWRRAYVCVSVCNSRPSSV